MSGSQITASNYTQLPPEQYGNDPVVEMQWAMNAYDHAEVYFSLLTAVGDARLLNLTDKDEEIYKHFRDIFPKFEVDVIDEAHMKSLEQKAVWREFAETYKGKVQDYNMGTLIRISSQGESSESNTTIVPRIQFLAIEIARNREGYNNGLAAKFGKKKEESSEQS